jgi:hypothetical protein
MHRRIALHIGQRESALTIAAIDRAEQREESGVLRNRHQLPVTPSPTLRWKVEWEDSNFSDKWICHDGSP